MMDVAPARRPGIALLTALFVVLLLTLFLSEVFFATGLELRSLQAYKDANTARTLARSALKMVEVGLLQDEWTFFTGYRQLQQLLTLAVVPLEEGRLITLDIVPVDSRFNVNDIAGLRQGTPMEIARHQVFQNLMDDIQVPAEEKGAPPEALAVDRISMLYAALMDWMDSDDVTFITGDGSQGAEAGAYFRMEPEYVPKNARLDRLEEIRLLSGFAEARIAWADLEQRFDARQKSSKAGELVPEKLNVNLAAHDEIVSFLEAHFVDDPTVLNSALKSVQTAVNDFAQNAAKIADILAPANTARTQWTEQTLKDALKEAGVNDSHMNSVNEVFATSGQYYRVRIVTEVADIQAHLNAVIQVKRGPDGKGTSAAILDYAVD